MKFIPVVIWMLLFPVCFYLAEYLSVNADAIKGVVNKTPISTELAFAFFIIWFGGGAIISALIIKFS